MAHRSARTRLLKPRTRPAERPSVRRRMVRRARLMGASGPETWDNLSFALRLGRRPRSVVTNHAQAHRVDQVPAHTSPAHMSHAAPHSITRTTSLPHSSDGIIDRYDGTRIGQQEIYAEITDEDEDALWKREWIEKARLRELPAHRPHSRLHRPRHVHQAHRVSSETGIVVVGADMRRQDAYILGRRVRTAHPQQHGSQSRPPLRQVQRHPDSRRGKRRRKPCRDHAEERDRAHPAHQVHPRQTWQADQGRHHVAAGLRYEQWLRSTT